MSGIDAKALMAEVKANLSRRNGCSRHHFEARDKYRLGDRLTCANCGTAMRLSEIGLYARGFMAAGGNPDDVLAGIVKEPES